MNEHGFELERGELNSEAKHKTVAEFKQEMAGKEIEKQLILNMGRLSMLIIKKSL